MPQKQQMPVYTSLPQNPNRDLLFWYPINATLTGNQAGVVASVTTDNDADFEWRWIIGSRTGTFSVSLLDKFTSRPLMTANINDVNLLGTAQLPFRLPKPILIPRTATIQGTFTDTSGAGNTIQLCLVGYKLG